VVIIPNFKQLPAAQLSRPMEAPMDEKTRIELEAATF